MLSDAVFWSSLYHGPQPPWFSDEQLADPTTSPMTLGYGQPLVRRTAWGLLPPLARKWKQQTESILPVISTAVLRSAWVERDSSVQTAMWEPLLLFLTGEYRARLSSGPVALMKGLFPQHYPPRGPSTLVHQLRRTKDLTLDPTMALRSPRVSHHSVTPTRNSWTF